MNTETLSKLLTIIYNVLYIRTKEQ